MENLTYIESLKSGLKSLLESGDVFVIGEDIAEPYGGAFKVTKGLSDLYPEKVISTPMSEQAFTGMGVGMALAGHKIIVEIMFGDFVTLTMDQVLNHASKFIYGFDKKLHFIIRTPMGGYRGYGATHSQSLEKLYFGLPNIFVIAPSIVDDPGKLLHNSMMLGKPVLFIENKLDYTRRMFSSSKNIAFYNIVKSGDENFPTTSVSFREETQYSHTIITYGGMVSPSLELQMNLYKNEEIAVRVICLSMLSPLDFDHLYELVRDDQEILIIEEGHIPFGFGDTIISQIFQRGYRQKAYAFGSKNQVIGASRELEGDILPDFKKIEKFIIEN